MALFILVSYHVPAAGNGDADGFLGEAFVEAFAIDGTNLDAVDASDQMGTAWIVTPKLDNFKLNLQSKL